MAGWEEVSFSSSFRLFFCLFGVVVSSSDFFLFLFVPKNFVIGFGFSFFIITFFLCLLGDFFFVVVLCDPVLVSESVVVSSLLIVSDPQHDVVLFGSSSSLLESIGGCFIPSLVFSFCWFKLSLVFTLQFLLVVIHSKFFSLSTVLSTITTFSKFCFGVPSLLTVKQFELVLLSFIINSGSSSQVGFFYKISVNSLIKIFDVRIIFRLV